MERKNVLAIIPARGGSKGIPRKNLLPIGGIPLVAHSILQAKATPAITRIVVSTDDTQIANVSEHYGAEIVRRPEELSGDKASSESALLHVLDELRNSEGYEPDAVVFLQATSPCRRPGEIQAAFDAFTREDADSLLSTGPVHGFVWRVEKSGETRSFSYDHLNRPRRQDAPEDLIENGSIYIFKTWVIRRHNNRLGGKIALHRMSALDSFQIDEPGDFDLLEIIMRHRKAIEPSPALPQPVAPRVPAELQGVLNNVQLLVLDFDGVMTDNRVLVSEEGSESVLCSREDGMGIDLLRKAGLPIIVLSKEKNPVVSARCTKLQIECVQACDDKLAMLQRLCEKRGVPPGSVAYVGNDVNDLECLKWVGLPIAVADAVPEVLGVAKWVTGRGGGLGAVREICDSLRKARLETK